MEFKILRLKLQLSLYIKKQRIKRREIGNAGCRAAPYSPKSSNFINTKSNAIFTSAGIIDTIARWLVPLP
jgi:hypothetical protein